MVNKHNMLLCVQGLESGEFPQGTGTLCDTEGYAKRFCCLGVFCEIAIRNGVPVEVFENNGRAMYDACENALPQRVRQWLDLDDDQDDPVIAMVDGRYFTAIWANDTENWTFPEIAGAFRKYYKLGDGDEPAESD